jgi:transcriptional regulator with XRE-family HTH domain
MARTERKISRITLAEEIGVTMQQIQKYEKGTNRIGAGRLQQICSVLQIPLASLFEGAPFPTCSQSASWKDDSAVSPRQ